MRINNEKLKQLQGIEFETNEDMVYYVNELLGVFSKTQHKLYTQAYFSIDYYGRVTKL